MNARIALSLFAAAVLLAACGNKGPLVQAPVETTVGASADMPVGMPIDMPAPERDDNDTLDADVEGTVEPPLPDDEDDGIEP